MNLHTKNRNQSAIGFTLVEMAIVLTIIGVLMAGLLPTLSGQIEQQRRQETRKQLDEIQQALVGYAIINGTLPCPTTTADPSSASYGVAAASCSTDAVAEGYLPWKTLSISETDAWGSKRSSAGDAWIGYWRYRIDRNFATTITLSTGFSTDSLLIRDTSGNSVTTTTERPVAIVYSTGANITVDGQNASYEGTSGIYQSDGISTTFDDMLIWISRPQLFNRMVTAGKLP